MERISALIDTLYQQKQQGYTPAQLLPTVQLLQSELLKLQQRNGPFGTAKVAVTLPANYNFLEEAGPSPRPVPEEKIVVPQEQAAPQAPPAAIPVLEEPVAASEYVLNRPAIREEVAPKQEPPKPAFMPSSYYAAFEAADEAPTLLQHGSKKELHEVIGESKESLNDRLKQQKTEVAHLLKDTPIKDLRKGIGVNDRFTFVSELFRGDEAMYERSIKTINSFGILSEAEYWINRELKFKLGWNDSKEVVQHFYHLVRRRFS